jgi:hypothetical protein
MLVERSFRRYNGKEMRLHELTDLVALRSPNREAKPPASTDKGRGRIPTARRGLSAQARLQSRTLDAIAPEVPLPEVRAFEDAGWVFVPTFDSDDSSAEDPRAKVFVKQGGRLALSTNRLVVQLDGEPSREKADELLRPYGCRVVETLNYAPGLFRVEVTDEAKGDTLDVANELVASGVCKFAEPELIEAVRGR